MKIDGTASLASMYLTGQIRGRSTESAGTGQGDTVTLSSEAKRLLEYFRTMRFEKDTSDRTGSEGASTGSVGAARDGALTSASGVSTSKIDASGGSGGSGTAGQMEDIRKRIKDLMDKVKHIMDGDMSPEQKHSAAAPYLQQIQELQQQLQELMTAEQKKA